MTRFTRTFATGSLTLGMVAATALSGGGAQAASRGGPALDARCKTGRAICIDKRAHRLSWVVNGKVVRSFAVRTGRRGMDTRSGLHHIYRKNANQVSNLYHVSMPYSQFFDGGEAVHYSKDFSLHGYGVGSHGCANMNTLEGARWLYSQTRVGDKVVVY